MTVEDTMISPVDDAKPKGRREREALADPQASLEDSLVNVQRIALMMGELGIFGRDSLQPAEWTVLKLIVGRRDVRIKEIRAVSAISPKQLYALLVKLEKRGLIGAKKVRDEDARAGLFSETPMTAAILASVSQQIQTVLPVTDSGKHQGPTFSQAARSMERLTRALRRITQKKIRITKKGQPEEASASARARNDQLDDDLDDL